MIPHLDEIRETFALLDSWEDKYAYLIDLGRKLPEFPDACKTDRFIIKGCVSQVWMILSVKDDKTISILADSDAHIVRGLISLVMAVYNGYRVEDVQNIDMQAIFDGLGLGGHLSPNRRNGFFSMVEKIKVGTIAAA